MFERSFRAVKGVLKMFERSFRAVKGVLKMFERSFSDVKGVLEMFAVLWGCERDNQNLQQQLNHKLISLSKSMKIIEPL